MKSAATALSLTAALCASFLSACGSSDGAGASVKTDAARATASSAVTGAVMKPYVRHSDAPPSPVHKVRDFGAKGDGVTDDTEALRKAIAACAGTGGSVLLDKGVFRTASLELKGGMTLYIAPEATLKATDKPSDFPVNRGLARAPIARAVLWSYGADNLRIDGGGTLDGNGLGLHKNGMNRYQPEDTRPSILRISNGKNITVRNVRLYNPHMWTQVYDHCENVLIEQQVLLHMPKDNSYNTDGMDICNCRHVVIRDNDLEGGDDTICLKSHGPAPTEDILVTNNTITNHEANGIKIGTATAGPIRNLRFINNHIKRAHLGGICIESVDGSDLSDVLVKGLTIEDAMHPIFIRLGSRTKAGSLTGVTLENVVVTPTTRGTTGPKVGNGWKEPSCTITGIPSKKIGEILLKDIRIVMPGGISGEIPEPKENDKGYPQSSIFGRVPASVFFIRHADKVRFENVSLGVAKPDSRPRIHAVNAEVVQTGVRDLGVVSENK